MLLSALSWMDVERRLQTDVRLVLVLGATEAHSDLSVCTDTLIPEQVARRACEAEGVLLVPSLPFGISTWSLDYPGTISLRTSTMAVVCEDIVRSLADSGFRSFIVLNGHGMNRAMMPVFGEIIAPYASAQVTFVQWWELEGVRALAAEWDQSVGHANWSETFAFNKTHPVRDVTVHGRPAPNLLQPPAAIRKAWGPAQAPGPLDLGEGASEKLLNVAVNAFREVLRGVPLIPEED